MKFDPLDPVHEELISQGYRHGYGGKCLPQDHSSAYRHGFRVGRNDRLGIAEQFQFDLIRRMREIKQGKSK